MPYLFTFAMEELAKTRYMNKLYTILDCWTPFRPKDIQRLKQKGRKNIYHANRSKRKAKAEILISDKIGKSCLVSSLFKVLQWSSTSLHQKGSHVMQTTRLYVIQTQQSLFDLIQYSLGSHLISLIPSKIYCSVYPHG